MGVTSLDYVVASHYDADHLNGVVEVLKTYDCDLVFSGDYNADTEIYEDYTSAVDKMEIREIPSSDGGNLPVRRGSVYDCVVRCIMITSWKMIIQLV